MVETTKQLVVAELKTFQQIQGVLRSKIRGHVVAVASVAVQLRHIPHLKFGAVGSCRVGCIDQSQSDVQIAVVVVADLSNNKAGFPCSDASVTELQSVVCCSCYCNDPTVAIQQRYRDDSRG